MRQVNSPRSFNDCRTSISASWVSRSVTLVMPTSLYAASKARSRCRRSASPGVPGRRLVLDEAVAVAEDPGGLAGLRIALDLARLPVGDLEIAVEPAEFQGQRVDGRIGPGAEEDRVVRGGLVQLLPRGEPPLARAA